jgi:hypothetical protein
MTLGCGMLAGILYRGIGAAFKNCIAVKIQPGSPDHDDQ